MEATQSAESRYIAHYAVAMAALEVISARIHDMPAPEGEIEIGWAHVGDMSHISDMLAEIVDTFPRPGHGVSGDPKTAGVVADA